MPFGMTNIKVGTGKRLKHRLEYSKFNTFDVTLGARERGASHGHLYAARYALHSALCSPSTCTCTGCIRPPSQHVQEEHCNAMIAIVSILLIRSSFAVEVRKRVEKSDGVAGWVSSTVVLTPPPLHTLTRVSSLCPSWVMRWVGWIGTAIVVS